MPEERYMEELLGEAFDLVVKLGKLALQYEDKRLYNAWQRAIRRHRRRADALLEHLNQQNQGQQLKPAV